MTSKAPILIAGGTGMVGSALLRCLRKHGYSNLHATYHNRNPSEQKANQFTPLGFESVELENISWHQCDHIAQLETDTLIQDIQPAGIVVAAAKVGGILANDTYRGEFIFENLCIETNLIHSAFKHNIKKLIFLGSACIYPKNSTQPIREEDLLTGLLEPTNEPYAIAKIAGVKLCESYHKQYGSNFYSLMPNNLYGRGDNFDLQTSHVLPALLIKFQEAKITGAKSVAIWGSGKPRREFLHVDDLAEAAIFCYKDLNASDIYKKGISHLNVGTGVDITIMELAQLIAEIVGYRGRIENDFCKPDGMQQKLLDSSRIESLGWSPSISLRDGIETLYKTEIAQSGESATN